ncbi:hypothetical protein QM565_10980 [Geitlerinema splendidum]|nr:hypothetical protein [Geitlerinema splendidum]
MLPTLGYQRIMEHPRAIAYGKQYPEFWVGTLFDKQPATAARSRPPKKLFTPSTRQH